MPQPEYDAVADPDQSYGCGHCWVPTEGDAEASVEAGLRIERIPGNWSAAGRAGHWYRLSDAGSGALLLDTKEIPNAELRPLDADRLLLKARLEQRETLFLIARASGSFRNLGTGEPPRPLAELAAAVADHLKQVNDGEAIEGNNWDHRERVFSPDGRFRLDRNVGEDAWGRPRSAVSVALTDSNETVFQPSYEWQHFGSEFAEDSVSLNLSGLGVSLVVSISPFERTGRIVAPGEPVLPLAALPARMNDFVYGRPPPQTQAPEARPPEPVPPAERRRFDWKGFLFALVPLLAGAGIVASALGGLRAQSAEAGAAAAWPSADGRVTRTWIETGSTAGARGRSYPVYRPRVAYAYRVQGAQFGNDRLSVGGTHEHMDRQGAEDELRAYPVGAAVPVRYDPASPGSSVLLIEGARSGSYIGLGFGLLLLGFGLFCLWMMLRPRRAGPATADLPEKPPPGP